MTVIKHILIIGFLFFAVTQNMEKLIINQELHVYSLRDGAWANRFFGISATIIYLYATLRTNIRFWIVFVSYFFLLMILSEFHFTDSYFEHSLVINLLSLFIVLCCSELFLFIKQTKGKRSW